MDIAGKGLQPHVDPLVKEIKRLDLTENVMELEAPGVERRSGCHRDKRGFDL